MMSCACEWVETRSTGDCRWKETALCTTQSAVGQYGHYIAAHTGYRDGMEESKECVSGAESSKNGVMRARMRWLVIKRAWWHLLTADPPPRAPQTISKQIHCWHSTVHSLSLSNQGPVIPALSTDITTHSDPAFHGNLFHRRCWAAAA